MAIIKTGSTIADIRGKVGDIVYTRGPGGAAVRSVGTWVQPDTAAQLASRNTMATLAAAWSDVLTGAQRHSWRSYAAHTPRPNRWGTPKHFSGYLMFIAGNVHAYQHAGSIVFPSAPTAQPLHAPKVAITINRSSLIATVTTPPINYPTPPANLQLYIASGIPISAGRSFYSGPWILWQTIEPPDAAGPDSLEFPWTWPVNSSGPAYTWPIDGTGQTRAWCIAQDMTTGARSTRHILFPTMVTP